MNQGMDEFVYKLPGLSGGSRPGAHRSLSRGAGMSFAGHARLFDQPDPRRLDLRASFSDIRGEWLVRTHLQRSAVSIKAIVDVSASMHFGTPGKIQVAAAFLQALGNSAHAYGDAASLLAFDKSFREDMFLPARAGRANASVMASTLTEKSAESIMPGTIAGLADTVEHIAGTTGLVFIVSDMHWSLDTLQPILDKLSAATVVPIVIWDSAEINPPAQGQLLPVRDSESGKRRHLWMSRKSRGQWLDNVQLRRETILESFDKQSITPFFIDGQFDAEKLSQYFMEKIV